MRKKCEIKVTLYVLNDRQVSNKATTKTSTRIRLPLVVFNVRNLFTIRTEYDLKNGIIHKKHYVSHCPKSPNISCEGSYDNNKGPKHAL